MNDPEQFIKGLLASFLLSGFLLFCALPIFYPRESVHHLSWGTTHLGEPETREEIHRTKERDGEDIITHLIGKQNRPFWEDIPLSRKK